MTHEGYASFHEVSAIIYAYMHVQAYIMFAAGFGLESLRTRRLERSCEQVMSHNKRGREGGNHEGSNARSVRSLDILSTIIMIFPVGTTWYATNYRDNLTQSH